MPNLPLLHRWRQPKGAHPQRRRDSFRVTPLLRGRTRERLVVVACDKADRVIGWEVVTEGSADRALMPVRETLVAVLRRDGKGFALAHNHPSGDPTPSREDIDATNQIRYAARPLGLRFIDHVVVTDTDWLSVPYGGDLWR